MQRITLSIVIVVVAVTFASLRSSTIDAIVVDAEPQSSGRTPAAASAGSGFNVVESAIPAMQAAMAKGQLTSVELVSQVLDPYRAL